MFYTSGTTGRPKGVRSSTQGKSVPLEVLEMMGAGISGMLSIPADGKTFVCGPVYHSAQWAFSFLPLMNGSQIVMRHRFDAGESLRLIDEHEITNVHLVPTQFTRLLRADDADKNSFSGKSLQVVWHGAAPCPPEVKRQMIEWWGPVVNEYYGSTEGSIVTVASAQEWLDRPGTVGKPSPMVQIKVVDENGQEVAAGESGEIYVKNVMGTDFEYHNEPEKTAAVHLEPGVFTFGDIGFFDEEGYLYLSDRKIDMIISGGENIYPAELENVLAGCPQVSEAAVIGVESKKWGETPLAIVVAAPGTAPTPESLKAYCKENLAGYKVPQLYEMVDALPRNASGKLLKPTLRAQFPGPAPF